MKRQKRLIAAILVVVMMLGVLSGCGTTNNSENQVEPTPEKKDTVQIVIGSGPIGGALYPIAGGLATLINNYCDNVKASVQVTAGGVENIRLVGNHEVDLGMAGGERLYQANNNVAPYKDENLKVEVLGTLHATVLQIVVLADSGMTKVQDLKGKKVSIGEAGGGAEQQFKQIVAALGWEEGKDIFMEYLPYDQASDQLADGLIDASVVYSGVPAAAITNLASRKPVQLLTIDEELQAKWKESVTPFVNIFETYPAGTYKGMENPATTGVQRIQLAISSEVDEETAYAIAKAIYEHLDELAVFHASAKSITKESAAEVSGAEMTEGAKRYFKEAGLLK